MLGGFIMHDLATFPLSFPRPDVDHLPPRSVIEGSELWSLSSGIARIAAGQRQLWLDCPVEGNCSLPNREARRSWSALRQARIRQSLRPLRWPYAETIDGGEIWVQPTMIEGEPQEGYVRSGFDFLFRTQDNRRTLHFDRQVSTAGPARGPQRKLPAGRAASNDLLTFSLPETNRDSRRIAIFNGAFRKSFTFCHSRRP
jgi:hypothetical protein